jgi:hypothetical protein
MVALSRSSISFAQTLPLKNFSAGLIVLAELSPRQLTVAQSSFFFSAALADRAGRPATFTELKEAVGPTVNRSLHTTYKVFLKEGRIRDGERAEGLGWLEPEVDSTDQRRKFLRLTPLGISVIDEILAAITWSDE